MNPIAVGALALMVSLAGLFLVLRAWPGPGGRHRGQRRSS